MPRKQSAKVLELFKDATKPRWDDTPRRKLARERNWCRYMLAGMEALARFMRRRDWLSEATFNGLDRAISSARYSVEASWYDRREELDAKEAAREARKTARRRA